MQRARSMLRCSLFSLFEGKVMTKILSLQTFLPLFLQLIATTAPKGDKSLTPPQNLSCSKDNLANSCNFQNYCLYLQRYRKLEDMSGALWRLCASSREADHCSVFHGLGLRLGECQHFQENVNETRNAVNEVRKTVNLSSKTTVNHIRK